MTCVGKVFLVGAGAGDPELITVRGATVLGQADLVLYDYLVNPEILRYVRPQAEQVCLGRHGRDSLWPPALIQQAMISAAQRGQCVVRLKSGDPLVFGRAAGELEVLAAAEIPFEVVPGITAALAAAAFAGVPVTDREVASAVAFITGQEDSERAESQLDYAALAKFPGTLVIYMGVTTAGNWSRQLMSAGMPATRPVMLVRRCSWPNQQRIACRLDEVADRVTPYAKFPPPVIAIVGEVARDVPSWNWFERRPLFGRSILVTRPAGQAEEMRRALRELGADVLVQPMIEIRAPESWEAVDAVQDRLGSFDWIVFCSVNGVDHFLGRWWQRGRDCRAIAPTRLAAVGSGTAEALAAFHLRADLVPASYRAESLVDSLLPRVVGKRCLLVRASRGREVLAAGLGAVADVEEVVAYRSLDCPRLDDAIADRLQRGTIDWVTVTSSSIAESAVRLIGPNLPGLKWASISPITTNALRRHGIEPNVEATVHTPAGLIDAIRQAVELPVADDTSASVDDQR